MTPVKKLFWPFARRAVPAEVSDASVPAGRRIYAIGDIHGRRDLFDLLMDLIVDDGAKHPDKTKLIVCLGDYVDRGMDCRGLIDRLVEPPPDGFERVCLMGNHEEFMVQFLQDASLAPVWMINGGVTTLASYGVRPPKGATDEDDFERVRRDLTDALPADHLEFLSKLKLMHREGDYLFVHAGIRPGIPLENQNPSDLLWIREEFLTSRADHGAVVVHGHTITDEVDEQPNRIGIDTGAYATSRLTCLTLDGSDRSYLQT